MIYFEFIYLLFLFVSNVLQKMQAIWHSITSLLIIFPSIYFFFLWIKKFLFFQSFILKNGGKHIFLLSSIFEFFTHVFLYILPMSFEWLNLNSLSICTNVSKPELIIYDIDETFNLLLYHIQEITLPAIVNLEWYQQYKLNCHRCSQPVWY